jgi:hypothetical protein
MEKKDRLYGDFAALHYADADAQKENLEKFKEDKNIEEFLKQQAIIGRMFKAGMAEILGKDACFPEND